MIKKKKFLFFFAKLAEAYPIGRLKYAPGTCASFIALITGYYILTNLNITNFIIFIIIFTILSYFLCEAHLKTYNQKDPSEIVVDEFAGQFIVLLATIQTDNTLHIFLSLILSFLLFRFFDITKLGPIKKMENLRGGLGIIADDLLAGIFALITQSAIYTYFNQPFLLKSYMG